MKTAATWLRELEPAVWKPVLIAALGFAAFWPTLNVGFMIDDPFLLRAIQAEPGFNLKGLKSDLTHDVHNTPGSLYYRPALGALTRAEFSLWGARPRGYHAVSLLFHLGGAILLFFLLSLLEIGGAVPLLTACLFAVNPVIIDDLLAATGGESMANFLMLASLFLFLKGKGAAAWLLSFPALFAKESNIVLPALLSLCLVYKGRFKEEFPKVLSLLPGCFFFLWMRHVYVASPPWPGLAPVVKFMVMSMPGIIFHYVRVLLLPLGLETWPRFEPWPPYWPLPLAACCAALAAIFAGRKKRPAAAFCAGWFVIMIAPRVPAMITNSILMDKWVFIAGPAVFIPLLLALQRLGRHPSPAVRAAPAALLSGLMIFWAAVAHANVRLRGSDEKNYRWTLRNGPRLFAGYKLGVMLIADGRPEEAVEALEPLLRLDPGQADCQNAWRWPCGTAAGVRKRGRA